MGKPSSQSQQAPDHDRYWDGDGRLTINILIVDDQFNDHDGNAAAIEVRRALNRWALLGDKIHSPEFLSENLESQIETITTLRKSLPQDEEDRFVSVELTDKMFGEPLEICYASTRFELAQGWHVPIRFIITESDDFDYAIGLVKNEVFHLIISDLAGPGEGERCEKENSTLNFQALSGQKLFEAAREHCPYAAYLAITQFGEIIANNYLAVQVYYDRLRVNYLEKIDILPSDSRDTGFIKGSWLFYFFDHIWPRLRGHLTPPPQWAPYRIQSRKLDDGKTYRVVVSAWNNDTCTWTHHAENNLTEALYGHLYWDLHYSTRYYLHVMVNKLEIPEYPLSRPTPYEIHPVVGILLDDIASIFQANKLPYDKDCVAGNLVTSMLRGVDAGEFWKMCIRELNDISTQRKEEFLEKRQPKNAKSEDNFLAILNKLENNEEIISRIAECIESACDKVDATLDVTPQVMNPNSLGGDGQRRGVINKLLGQIYVEGESKELRAIRGAIAAPKFHKMPTYITDGHLKLIKPFLPSEHLSILRQQRPL